MLTRILVVDEEPQLLPALRSNLVARRYEILTAVDGREALDVAARHAPGLVMLANWFGDGNGLGLIAALRGWTAAPIVVLADRLAAADRIDALDAGADACLTRPFCIDEVMARVRALLRRAEARRTAIVEAIVGNHRVDMIAKTVVRTEDAPSTVPPTVHLTKTEWALLEALVRNPGRLVSSARLLSEIRGPEFTKDTGYLRFYMARLRGKLEPVPGRPQQLLTETGLGYRFQP